MITNDLIMLILQITIASGMGLILGRLLTPVLARLLVEICGGPVRAAFWVTFTRLMLATTPLLLVITLASPEPAAGIAAALRETLIYALCGVFIALSAIGAVMWRFAGNAAPLQRDATRAGQG